MFDFMTRNWGKRPCPYRSGIFGSSRVVATACLLLSLGHISFCPSLSPSERYSSRYSYLGSDGMELLEQFRQHRQF